MTPRLRFGWLQKGLLVFGILLLAQWSRTDSESRGFQAAESRKLGTALREARSDRSGAVPRAAAFAGPPASGPAEAATGQEEVLGRIEIPRLRIAAIIAEGVDERTLKRAVGHVASTARPGSPGNCALAGHRDTFLRGLGGVRIDDVIRITTLAGTYTYQVEWSVVVEPRRVDVLDSTAARSLTLVTCYPFAFVGRAPQRFVVRARQVWAPVEPPDATPSPGGPAVASTSRGAREPRSSTAQTTDRTATEARPSDAASNSGSGPDAPTRRF